MFDKRNLKQALRLYAVTDNAWLGERTLAQCVEEALAGGATFVQLRDKHAAPDALAAEAAELLALCRDAGVPFVVNDEVECALAVGADGVHVGQDDTACERARALLGPDAIVGVSAQTVEQARAAEAAGADYLGVGGVRGTATKPEAGVLTPEEFRAIAAAVDIPVVAIGGVNAETIPLLADLDVDGAAVVSAIFAADDIEGATRELSRIIDETL
ncbi:thiamine phosphate synthase [uncultured Adlercreutzia sp.]|uniref:thiamine phosphate synthase n=1 Tax=uncultured Adlercreutzia sp. TaxID=875803 RepID=UPI0026753455|nr:thiamine phosphate synthase [uncultured Adlercreutzia sp.]